MDTNKGNQSNKMSRASVSCVYCRRRKKKCNLVESGESCSNCQSRGLHCVAAESKRGSLRERQLYATSTAELTGERSYGYAEPMVDLTDVSYDDLPLGLLSGTKLPPSRSYLDLNIAASFHGDLMTTPLAATPPKKQSVTVPLPTFVKPLPATLAQDDIQYLWMKGALSIPDLAFRKELAQSYVDHVHCSLPLVALDDLLQIMGKDDEKLEKMSLVVFQAIMFAGIAFVDLISLQLAGFATRREARKAFYQKVRLLYEFDAERDHIALVQSLILMTLLNESPGDVKDEWYWMGIAVSLANTVGLDNNPDESAIGRKACRLRKRIWWCVLMRDRLLALGMRRPSKIKDADYDVPALKVEDFEVLCPNDYHLFPTESWVVNNTLQDELATIFIEKAGLCVCIGHVLSTQYATTIRDPKVEPDHLGRVNPRVVLAPKTPKHADDIYLCEMELTHWHRMLPDSCLYQSPSHDGQQQSGPSLIIERAVLHLLYLAASCTFYWPIASSARTGSGILSPGIQARSQPKLREAARETTKIVQDIRTLNMTRFIPATGVTALLPTMTGHLIDVKSRHKAIREEALQRFSQCMYALDALRDSYGVADNAFQFLSSIIKQADVEDRPATPYENPLDVLAGGSPASATLSETTVSDILSSLDDEASVKSYFPDQNPAGGAGDPTIWESGVSSYPEWDDQSLFDTSTAYVLDPTWNKSGNDGTITTKPSILRSKNVGGIGVDDSFGFMVDWEA